MKRATWLTTTLGTTLGVTLASAALCLAGCPGQLDDPAAFESYLKAHDDAGSSEAASLEASDGAQVDANEAGATPACGNVPTTLFAPTCGPSGCHGTSMSAAGLDLVSPDVFGRLVGQAATGGPGVLIDPGGDPNTSVLYLKLTPTPPFGSQMPLTGAKLEAASLACVASWIMTSAHGDGGVTSMADAAADSEAVSVDAAIVDSQAATDSGVVSTGMDSAVMDSAAKDSAIADTATQAD